MTGAAGGIGREIAHLFRRSGANMVLADRDVGALEEVAEGTEGAGRTLCLAHDVADSASSGVLVDAAIEAFGGIDFVVPSAGIYRACPFAKMDETAWRETLSVNLDGVFHILHWSAAHLRPNASVVMLSSLAAARGAFENAHYAASKGALTSLTKSLARELAPSARVNAIAPGLIATPMTRAVLAVRGERTLADTPLGRFGVPSEIASIVAFLCSDAASFITGETIHANGGLYMA